MEVHQSVSLYASVLETGKELIYKSDSDRCQWVQVISGEVSINRSELSAGDGAAITGETKFRVSASKTAEFLLFDLPQ